MFLQGLQGMQGMQMRVLLLGDPTFKLVLNDLYKCFRDSKTGLSVREVGKGQPATQPGRAGLPTPPLSGARHTLGTLAALSITPCLISP